MADKKTTITLKFVGKSLATGKPLDPPEYVIDGNDTINLPDAETQKKGFSLATDEETLRVARLFPTMFKQFVVKSGESVETDTESKEDREGSELDFSQE